jgi:hypothetical protein
MGELQLHELQEIPLVQDSQGNIEMLVLHADHLLVTAQRRCQECLQSQAHWRVATSSS